MPKKKNVTQREEKGSESWPMNYKQFIRAS